MKKVLALILALVLVLSLAACGNSGENKDGTSGETKATEVENTTTYSLGETVSTDIFDFTMKEATFSVYANGGGIPIKEKDDSEFNHYQPARVGQCMVCMTYSIKNKDRTALGLSSSDDSKWKWNFAVNYKGETYPVSGQQDKQEPIFIQSTLISNNGGKTFTPVKVAYKMEPQEEWIIRAVGYIDKEPDSLDDGFLLTVNVIDSSSKDEFFTYKVGK